MAILPLIVDINNGMALTTTIDYRDDRGIFYPPFAYSRIIDCYAENLNPLYVLWKLKTTECIL